MNANELADELEKDIHWIQDELARKWVVDMLRQQQAEIEALKGLIEVLRMGQPNIDYDKELLKPTFVGRELTDEEILNVLKKIADNNEYVYSLYEDFSEVEFSKVGIFEFARAILRKAQEK